MATGGFKYVRVTLTPTDDMKASKTVFAKAVHKTRCEAFLRATTLAGQTWSSVDVPVGGGIYRTYSESVNKNDTDTVTVYVQDYAYNATGSFLGYVSVFKKDAAEYMILTVNAYSTSTMSDKAVALGSYKKLMSYSNTTGGLVATLAHAYAVNGFASYDLNSNNFPASGELVPYPCFGSHIDSNGRSDYTIINRYYDSNSYIFGYSIKDDVIMTFLKRDDWSYCKWGIIGKIFNEDCIGGNPYGAITTLSSNNYEHNQTGSTRFFAPGSSECTAQVLDFNGKPLPVYRGSSYSVTSMLTPSYFACERRSSYSGDMRFGALCVSLQTTANSIGSDSIGENGENVKGFINTDILRVIPPQRARTDGALLKGGEFITLANGTDDIGAVGICIGWDPSNPSLY